MAQWIYKTPAPYRVDGSARVGNLIYTFSAATNNQNKVQLYNIDTDTWSLLGNFPVSFNPNFAIYIPAVSIGERIFVWYFSGTGEENTRGGYEYIPSINSWRSIPHTGSFSAANSVFCASEEKIYAANEGRSLGIFDIDNFTWTTSTGIPNAPGFTGNSLAGVTLVYEGSGNIYCLGGWENNISTGLYQSTSTTRIYNISTASWTFGPDMNSTRYMASGVSNAEKIYAVGGLLTRTPSTNNIFTEEFSIIDQTWRFLNDAPSVTMFKISSYFFGHDIISIPVKGASSSYYPIFYDIRDAKITSPSPIAGFVNERIENTFRWVLQNNPKSETQSNAIFQWKEQGSEIIHSINAGINQYVIVPANTFPSGLIEWRVTATNTGGIIAPYTQWFQLTTIDAIHDKPTGLYPSSGTRDGTREIDFSWIMHSPISTPQFGFEIQTTYDQGRTWNDLSGIIESQITQYIASPNSIYPTNVTGNTGWRVRTYNTDDIPSNWSDTVYIIVHAAPKPPTWISVESDRSRPLARWISVGQIGFQINVVSGNSIYFDSGEIFGTTTEYRIPEYIRNSSHVFRIRIKNPRGLWSDWADFPAAINARQTLTISLNGEQIQNGAQLNFNADVR